MRKTFIEYNTNNQDELKALWDNALFIFDTNVLLNLYRYSEETTEQFLKTISDLKSRIWIPHNVGVEFHQNRLIVLSEQKKSYQEFEKKFNAFIQEVEDKNRNPFLSKDLLSKLLGIKIEIKSESETKIKYYERQITLDNLLSKINIIFEGCIGEEPENESLNKIYSEGEKRFSEKVPPGYEDSKKPIPDRYGDLVIWKQIIEKSVEEKTNIIFITDDNKEDWWLIHEGKRISARPELLKEFNQITDKQCHFYQPSQFLKYSKENLGSNIKDETIEEVQNLVNDIHQITQFIFIAISIEGEFSDLEVFILDMKDAGFNVYLESEEIGNEKLHAITIVLASISELERELKSKYLANLGKYNLRLISMNAR